MAGSMTLVIRLHSIRGGLSKKIFIGAWQRSAFKESQDSERVLELPDEVLPLGAQAPELLLVLAALLLDGLLRGRLPRLRRDGDLDVLFFLLRFLAPGEGGHLYAGPYLLRDAR